MRGCCRSFAVRTCSRRKAAYGSVERRCWSQRRASCQVWLFLDVSELSRLAGDHCGAMLGVRRARRLADGHIPLLSVSLVEPGQHERDILTLSHAVLLACTCGSKSRWPLRRAGTGSAVLCHRPVSEAIAISAQILRKELPKIVSFHQCSAGKWQGREMWCTRVVRCRYCTLARQHASAHAFDRLDGRGQTHVLIRRRFHFCCERLAAYSPIDSTFFFHGSRDPTIAHELLLRTGHPRGRCVWPSQVFGSCD